MLNSETIETELSSAPALIGKKRNLEIPNVPSMRLQTLDFARHIAVAPDGKRYVVATYDETRLKRGIMSAVFPQQNEYLTLVRLTVCEFLDTTVEDAIQRHVALIQSIQQGKLRDYIRENQVEKAASSPGN